MKIRLLTSIIVLIAITVVFHSTATAQLQRSVLDGVFTEAQAGRGEQLVNSYGCAYCHGGGLVGGNEDVPPLVGSDFTGLWDGRPLSDLHKMVSDMPPDTSDKLSVQGRVDVIAYLLWLNWYPAGEYELPPDPAVLTEIQIVLP